MHDPAPAGVTVLDAALRFVSVDAVAARAWGRDAQDLEGRRAAAVMPARTFAALEPLLRAALGGVTGQTELAAGGPAVHALQIGPLRTGGADAAGVLVLAHDVTRRRAAERAVTARERRYRELIENASDVVTRADADVVYTYVSPSVRRVFGWTPEQMLGRSVRDFVHPADREALARMRRALAAGSAEEVLELRVPRPDGSYLWVESRCRAVRDEHGAPQVQTSARDISDRKAAEAAKQASDEEFRTAFDDAAIGMAVIAPDGTWLRVNEALCRIVGYRPEQLRRLTFQDITHPDDMDADVALAEAVLRGDRRTYQLEKRYIRADGTLVWVLLSVSLVRDTAGEPLHFISQIQDISERRRLEAELHRLATEDPLTGLHNRRSFEDHVAQELRRCQRSSDPAAVLVLDLDGFKAVNDSLGHLAGDALLRHVAALLRGRLRASDVVARFGGDEFAVLLPRCTVAGAACLADALMAEFTGRPVIIEETQVTASASIGVAALDPGLGALNALREADRAMYGVKQSRQRAAVTR